MEEKTYLGRYRVCVDRVGIPIVVRRSADETTVKAEDLKSGAQVAVQLVPAPPLGAAEQEQLRAEARAAQQINHVCIPALRDFGFDDDHVVYVTELLEGITAEEWVKTKGPMPLVAVLRVASQVLSALVAAGLHGIIHHSVRPGTIIFSTDEATRREWPSIKVLNLLGMAPSLTLPEVAGSGFLHPASFASPEQLEDGPVTFRSEIYSLGCTLWYLLKGAPLAGGAGAVRGASELPAPVRELLASMVAKIPAARPADPVALEKQIQECLALAERPDPVPEKHEEVAAVVARPVQEIEPKPRPTRRWATMPLALAALLLALATLAAVVVITRGRQASSSTATLAREPHALPPPVAQRASAEIPRPTIEPKPTPIEARSDLFATRDHSPASPVVEATLPAPPHEENVESTGPMTASSSAPPDARVAAMEAALLEHFPTTPEPSPPAEGPDTDERSATEPQLMPPDLVAAEEGQSARLEVPVPAASSPPPKKTSSSASRTNSSRKTTAPLIEASPPPQQQRYLSARHYRATNVGHIFFPIWLEPQAEKPTATASPAEQPRRSRHTAGQKNTASRAAARQKSTTPGEAPPGLRGDDEERPVLPALPPDT